ncbi:phenol hydroxylase subunit P4 [Nitrincola alkalisediminis]|uniref:phenol hydroxylase subunit P4 n=1 Tax=Nitrincola alkalisediminis TaxID=1366656 RepID=UPI0018763217|nr:phenol hydroxylase subunit P4 [Nitrincola alkalisediminis]
MSVRAITPDYKVQARDRVENFHGNQIVYVAWDRHLMFCAPFAYALPPTMTFAELRDQVMPEAFGLHEEFSKINWETTTWLLDNQPFTPDLNQSLKAQGVGHKSVLRFQTPELTGFQGKAV